MDFTPGQRWISNTETELGLGIVITVHTRQVTLLFPASDEKRIYAFNNAPVTRVVFNIGDTVCSHEGWQCKVSEVNEKAAIYYYSGIRLDTGQPVVLSENLLDSHLVFSRPQDRLFTGNIDGINRFVLRYQARQYYSQQYRLPISGLRGSRTSLIPHQLHIAHEVAHRHAPRVLLADEVGLGKTIEAGMIIHHQLLAGSASRVLIVVPENLQHQWLVEMLRRFNLQFALFDNERYAAIAGENANPFETEQLVLCSLDFVCDNKLRLNLLCQGQWDLLIVDEAHHLLWHETEASKEYCCVEQLAQHVPGVLLLTATPEQLGMESHFARLRLLDPNRFHDLAQFLNEQHQYRPVADALTLLLSEQRLKQSQLDAIREMVSEQDISDLLRQVNNDRDAKKARNTLISLLLDRHGTSRVLFRNTRHSISGFPDRVLHRVPLPLPAPYQVVLDHYVKQHSTQPVRLWINGLLCPEQLYQQARPDDQLWYDIDPRVDWLISYLLQHRQQKVLVICAHASTALYLEQVLRERQGIRASVFYEGMSIIERDRAAAWFADQLAGAQVLLCSEIGSEGRNFQFASVLVMFDLPLNPDLLEQRIGRLDRIGQRHEVQIYVPYLENTAQALLLHWYHQGLNAFEHSCCTGQAVLDHFYQQLTHHLLCGQYHEDFTALIRQCQAYHLALKQQLEQGRDRLLEIHSSGDEAAQKLASDIAGQDQNPTLVSFCNILFDIIGLHYEELDDELFILQPHSTMLIPDFPGLPKDGCTVTFNRELALMREEVQFLSWEHPVIRNGLDLVLTGDIGICSLALLKFPELPAGTLLLELLYVVDTSAAKHLRLSRFLPPTPLRLLLDKNGHNLANTIDFNRLQNRLTAVNRHVAVKLANMVQAEVSQMLRQSESLAQQAAQEIIQAAHDHASTTLDNEIMRLQALKQVNPGIRDDELLALRHNRKQILACLDKAHWRLDALLLIVVSE